MRAIAQKRLKPSIVPQLDTWALTSCIVPLNVGDSIGCEAATRCNNENIEWRIAPALNTHDRRTHINIAHRLLQPMFAPDGNPLRTVSAYRISTKAHRANITPMIGSIGMHEPVNVFMALRLNNQLENEPLEGCRVDPTPAQFQPFTPNLKINR